MAPRSTRLSYSVGFLSVSVALVLRRFFLQGLLGDNVPFSLFYIAISASGWYGGMKSGLTATIFSALAADYYFFDPEYSFRILDKQDQVALGLFLFEGVLISLVSEAMHSAKRMIQNKNQALETQMQERAKTAAALLSSEKQFRALYELASVGIAFTEIAKGYFLQANRKFCEILGYGEKELQEKTFFEIAHPEDKDKNLASYQSLVRGSVNEYSIENRYLRKDGAIVWVVIKANVLDNIWGRPHRIIMIIQDITERKKIENTLKEADIRKDEFLAILAHELRNPLASLSNGMHVLQLARDNRIREEAQKIIEQQLIQMVRLIDDLMDVSRINQGKIELRKEQCLISELMNNAIKMAAPLIEEKNQKIILNAPEKPVWVNADSVRLIQALVNLLNNAAKYTDNNGCITCSVYQEKEEAVVVVRDSGIGIPQDMLAHIFEMFAQVDHSLERAKGGLGIGLTLARNLIALHGGSIEVYSEGVGKGSEFTVRLPLSVSRTPNVKFPAAQSPSATRVPCRVLVVDDNVASAKSMGWMLEVLGHEIKLAHDGKAALALAPSFLPNVVLLDIGLPNMDGYELCRRMRQDPVLQNTVFVAQTGWGQPEHRALSKEAGFDHHLVKPVDLEMLTTLLDSLHVPAEQH